MDLEPVLLNCRHTFCRGCLKDAYAKRMTLCPICRQEISHRQWLSIMNNDTATELIVKPSRQANWQSRRSTGVSSGITSRPHALWTGATAVGRTMSYGSRVAYHRSALHRPSTSITMSPSTSVGLVPELGVPSAASLPHSSARPSSSYDIGTTTSAHQRGPRGPITTGWVGLSGDSAGTSRGGESERLAGRRTEHLPPLQSPR
jgi:hypothetical protein